MAQEETQGSAAAQKGFIAGLEDNTNFTIKLSYCTWRVHSHVVAKNSAFFAKICTTNTWKESKERAVELHDDNPWRFARLLQLFYFGDFCVETDEDIPDCPGLEKLVNIQDSTTQSGQRDDDEMADAGSFNGERIMGMIDIARKYMAPALEDCAVSKFRMYRIYKPSPLHALVDQCTPFGKGDESLRKAVAEKIAGLYEDVRGGDDEAGRGIRKWMEEDMELSWLVMDALAVRKRL